MSTSFKDIIKPILTPIHPEGWGFIAIFVVVTLIVGVLWSGFWLIGGVLSLWCIYFFRDPKRHSPINQGLVISPADGIVQSIEKALPPPELEMGNQPMLRIAVFMNVFDVHVNRMPMHGTIMKLAYHQGKFFNASLDKASKENERLSYRLSVGQAANQDIDIAMVQIAGLVARRILCEVNEGDELKAGDRVGMIRFGSRVDIYVPQRTPCLVCVGQRMIAGETVLAELSALTPKGRRLSRTASAQ